MDTRRQGSTGATLTPLATFSGLRGVPLLALSRNSLFPRIVIAPDAVTVRVVRNHRLAYEDLERVDVASGAGTRMVLTRRRGWRTFTVLFASRAQTRTAVRALAAYGAPVGSDLLARLDAAAS